MLVQSHSNLGRASSEAFLNAIDIKCGPDELLARFFIMAAEIAASYGITLEIGTFDELLEVNRRNRDTWMPITTTFRPDEGGANDETGVVVFGRNADGKVVTTHAARLFDWSGSSFRAEAQSLRLFYQNPDRWALPDERCEVTTERADSLGGRCAYIGGLWFHPSVRGGGRTRYITRVIKALPIALWDLDHLCGIVTPTNLDRNYHRRTGWRDVAAKSVHMHNSPSKPDGVLDMTLCRATPMQVVDDLFAVMMEDLASPQVDALVRQSGA